MRLIEDCEMHYMNAWLMRCVFNLDLIRESVSEPRTLSGRLFQSLGAKLWKKIEIHTRCVQLWHHLHQSDPDSIQYKALLANETSADYSFNPKTIIKEIDKNLKDTHDESLKNTL